MSVIQLLPGAVGQGRERIIYGEVSSFNPPAGFDDPLHVIQPDWDPHIYWVIADWPACHGQALPKPGSPCILLEDGRGNLRCVWWQGVHSPRLPSPFCNKLSNFLLSQGAA